MNSSLLLFNALIAFLFLSVSPAQKKSSSFNVPPNLNSDLRSEMYGSIHSLLVVKSGVEIIDYSVNDEPAPVESVSKSIAGLVVAIAVDKGFLKLEDPVSKHLSAFRYSVSNNWNAVTIRDLLKMKSGLIWEEDKRPESENPVYNMYSSADPFEYILKLPVKKEKQFNYSSGDAALLSAVVQSATGSSVQQFAQRFLFQPLGIENYKWADYKNGFTNTSGGLMISPSDLIKVGQLVLQDGIYNGKRIISSTTLHQLFEYHAHLSGYSDVDGYGMMWWLNSFDPGTGYNVKIVSANGFANKHLLICKELDLAIVITGVHNYNSHHYFELIRMIFRTVIEQEEKLYS